MLEFDRLRLAAAILASSLALPVGSGQGNAAALLAFDVASVRQNTSGTADVSSNVPLGPGNVYAPTGGVLAARNFPLMTYVDFAYRLTDAQEVSIRKQVPEWVKTDRFDVQARTDKQDVSKDELRLMMRELLAERFGLAVHDEMREVPVYALTLVKPGETGPGLRRHSGKAECGATRKDLSGEGPEVGAGGFPEVCGGLVGLPATGAGLYRIGGSDVTMSLIADSFAGWGGLNRPVVDRTGLAEKVDFALEYLPQRRPEADSGADEVGPAFQEALRKQMGLRLEASWGAVKFLVLERIGHLTAN